jgi:hypothetical protein
MTDIVERLRASAATWVEQGGYSPNLHEDAADEIEKLRKGWLDQAARDAAEIVRLEVEIERLRKTLRAVYDWCGYDAPDHEEIERVLKETT